MLPVTCGLHLAAGESVTGVVDESPNCDTHNGLSMSCQTPERSIQERVTSSPPEPLQQDLEGKLGN